MRNRLVKKAVRVSGTLLVLSFACYLAYAFSTGITGQTKKNSQTAGCGAKTSGGGGCHGASPNTNVQVLLSGPSVLPVGVSGTYTISVSGETSAGGGCDIASTSGTLSSSSNLLQSLNQELTHVSPIATPYSIEFAYVSNSPGQVTMYANGKASSGWNWAPNLSIRVGPPPAPTLLLPADGSSAVPTGVVLVWSGIQGPKWSLEVSSSQSFASTLVKQDSLTDTTYVISEGALANNTQYFWRVRGNDAGGTSAWSQVQSFSTALTGVEEKSGSVPSIFALEQNYPNPFNPATKIGYSVGGVAALSDPERIPTTSVGMSRRGVEGRTSTNVRLVVYDLLGRQVVTLVDEAKAPGQYEVSFDGSGLASGVYVYRLTTGSLVQSRTMVLMK